MSTSAASAQDWLEQQPSNEQIVSAISALEARIERHGDQADRLQGSIEALDYLERQLALRLAAEDSVNATPLPSGTPSNLDLSNLGLPSHDLAPAPRSGQEKRLRFEELKRQMTPKA